MSPPPLARAFLRRLLPAADREAFDGELEELYRLRAKGRGRLAARWWYRRQVADLALRRGVGTARIAAATTTRTMMRLLDMDALRRDVAYAARRLLRTPAFTLVAVLSLALGIGANTAMFSVVNAVLLREPPFTSPDELVEVYTSESSGFPYSTSSLPDIRDLAEASARDGIFSEVVASQTVLGRLGDAGEAEVVFGEAVSSGLFHDLGVAPVAGRGFGPDEDDVPGEDPVAVLGYHLWQQRFGADPGVVGQEVRLNQDVFTVVGVAPEWYTGSFPAFRTSVFVPTSMIGTFNEGAGDRWGSRGNRSAFVKARLAPGVSAEQAQAWLTRFADELAEAHPESNRDRTMTLLLSSDVAVHPLVDGALLPVAALLLVVVGLVLLIACTNLAAFLLARAEARRSEIAVRLSLGAARWVLVRQLVVETVLLALLGGAAGLLLARWTVDLLVSFRPPIPIPLSLDFPLDGTVMAYTLGVSLVAGLLFGLAPALQSTRADLASAMRSQGGRGSTGRSRLRGGLVVAQLALSLVLLVGSGLFVRSLRSVQNVDPGFYTGNGAVIWPQMELTGLSEDEVRAFNEQLAAGLEARPGVAGVAFTDNLPLGFGIQTTGLTIPGSAVASSRADGIHDVDFTWVDPGFFEVMGVPLVRGRTPTRQDAELEERVAVVSEAFVRRFWPEKDPLQAELRTASGDPIRVVGVARDTKVRSLGEDSRPRLYYAAEPSRSLQVVVTGSAESAELLRLARDEALALRPDLLFFDQRTMEEHLAVHLFPPRMAALLLSVFGGLALLLAAVGIWGVVSHAVARRTREVGIRVSLGATGGEVIRLLVSGGMRLVAAGVVVGLVLAAAMGSLVSGFLYGIGAVDPVTFVAVPLLLVGVALGAAWLPARRAARVDPVRALRME